jgi:hypothetical protein
MLENTHVFVKLRHIRPNPYYFIYTLVHLIRSKFVLTYIPLIFYVTRWLFDSWDT